MGNEEVGIASIVAAQGDLGVRPHALAAELDAVAVDTGGLALHSNEPFAEVEHQVVAMIDTTRKKDLVSASTSSASTIDSVR